MARPIKETPILYGEDAQRLQQAMNHVVPESPNRKAEMQANYEFFMRMFNRKKKRKEEGHA